MSDHTLDAFKAFSCFDVGYVEGLTFPMRPDIKPLVPGTRMLGRAFTLDEDNAICKNVFDEIGPDQVLVVRGNDPQQKGGCGLMICELIARRGAVGVVIDGAAQDSPKLRAYGFPVFCREIRPTHGSLRLVGKTQTPVECGGVHVEPGDIVMGDDDGVVVIPARLEDEVLRQARLMREARDYVDDCVRKGIDLWDIPGVLPMWAEKEKGLDYHWKVYESWNEQYVPQEFRNADLRP